MTFFALLFVSVKQENDLFCFDFELLRMQPSWFALTIEEHNVADSFATCEGLVPCVPDKPYGLCGHKPP